MAELQLKESSPTCQMKAKADQLKSDLTIAFQNAGDQWNGFTDRILCMGPRGSGPNILVNRSSLSLPSFWTAGQVMDNSSGGVAYLASLINGFDSATRSGPLCEEPLVRIDRDGIILITITERILFTNPQLDGGSTWGSLTPLWLIFPQMMDFCSMMQNLSFELIVLNGESATGFTEGFVED